MEVKESSIKSEECLPSVINVDQMNPNCHDVIMDTVEGNATLDTVVSHSTVIGKALADMVTKGTKSKNPCEEVNSCGDWSNKRLKIDNITRTSPSSNGEKEILTNKSSPIKDKPEEKSEDSCMIETSVQTNIALSMELVDTLTVEPVGPLLAEPTSTLAVKPGVIPSEISSVEPLANLFSEPTKTSVAESVESLPSIISVSNDDVSVIKVVKPPTKPRYKGQLEDEVGILVYIGKHNGFNGHIKYRYSDFVVNEISLDGEVVHLTTFDLPKEEEKTGNDQLKSILTADDIEQIENLAKDATLMPVLIKAVDIDKEKRTAIHNSIKDNYQTLTSSTQNFDNERFIVVRPLSEQTRIDRKTWPRCRPNFTHFVLYKENKDTMETVNLIASILRLKPSLFTYAGTKDKRGKTTQMVSMKRLDAKRIMGLNKHMALRNVKIGNVTYKPNALTLGDLAGNRFTIILREIDASDVDLQASMVAIKEKGFINYYGLQRFGTREVSTHTIGRALIKGDFQEAIDLVLKPRNDEDRYMVQCRRIWSETRNPQNALKALRKKDSLEGLLLQGLAKHKSTDYVNALNFIPRNMRLMYLHSYQSYIWNMVVSNRISTFGLEPRVGDLFIVADVPESNADSVVSDKLNKDEKPKVVTQENLDKNLVSIYDIVLPLPGNDVVYPENETADFFKEVLGKDDLNFQSFVSRVRQYSLSGSYRRMIVKPKNVKWSVLKYEEKDEDLCLSDMDLFNKKELQLNEAGQFRALKLQIDLPSSSYATMAIREITKRTSVWTRNDL